MILVFLEISSGLLLQVTDSEVHVDARLGEFELVDHAWLAEEPSLFITKLLCFRLGVEALLELHQFGLELLRIWQHIEGPSMVLNLLSHAILSLFGSLISW